MRYALTVLLLMSSLMAHALEREAFTITRYQLEVQIDRTTHVIAVTGKVTLRNHTKAPQKLAVLQVSSSLAWSVIELDGKPLEWLGDNYTSDIDHTGNLSEAIVTLPNAVPPAGSITLEVQYGGTITQDATRLTRMDAPAEVAARSEWDQITDSFTAVRGLGYVAWYPVAIEAVSLSDGDAVFNAIANWKQRHARSQFDAQIVISEPAAAPPLCIAVSLPDSTCGEAKEETTESGKVRELSNRLQLDKLGESIPAFALANYVELARPGVRLLHAGDATAAARDYALAAEANDPLLHEWLPEPRRPALIIELTDPQASSWQDGAVLFTPLRAGQTAALQLLLMPTQVASRFQTPRAWIEDGLERLLQVVSVEQRSGRRAALQYLSEYREPLVQVEAAHAKAAAGGTANASDNTLLNTPDEVYLHSKGGYVFWMLREMVGSEALQRTLAAYRGDADNEPSYFQRLVQASSKRELEWFFDDWVYRDHGLPDFHVDSVYPRALLSESEKNYLVTATVENRGHAGAEVPILVQTPSGERSARVLVKAGEKATARIEVPMAPSKLIVNDGSVPEANAGNNEYMIPAPGSRQ